MATSTPRTSIPLGAVLAQSLCMLVVGLSACAPDEGGPQIEGHSPVPVYQEKKLQMFGSGFAPYVEGSSGVLVGDACAPVVHWSDSKIVVIVPGGSGVGSRRVDVFRADGRIATRAVEIVGPELPPDPAMECAFRPSPPIQDLCEDSVPDVVIEEIDIDSGHVDLTPDTIRVDLIPDTTLVDQQDTAPNCPIATGIGACSGPADCEKLQTNPFEMSDKAAECTTQCLGEADPRACTGVCVARAQVVTEECSICFGEFVDCTIQYCGLPCVSEPGSGHCDGCERTYCGTEFERCGGIPLTRVRP